MPAVLVWFVATLPLQQSQSAPSRPTPAPAISGEVLGQDGKPVAGAAVLVLRWFTGTLHGMTHGPLDATVDVARVTTGREGRFRVEVPEGQPLAARAELAGHGLSEPVTGFAPGDHVTLRLLPALAVQGRVQRLRDGKPVPAPDHPVWCSLRSQSLHPHTPAEDRRSVRIQTRSGADGSYRLEVPDTGETTWVAETALDGEMLRGTDLVQTREPVPAACILVDRKTGQPVADARVLPIWGDGFVPTASDARGRIETQALHQGWAQVVPRAHARRVLGSDHLRPAAEGEPTRLELEPGVELAARLLRSDQSPVANAQVLLTGPVAADNMTFGGITFPARTDADGRLRLGCLQAGQSTTGFVELDGVWVPFLCRELDRNLDLGDVAVRGTTRMAGRVVAPDGAPVAGAQVLLLPPLADKAPSVHPPPVRPLHTDRLGRFAVPGLTPGVWRVAARSARHAPGFAAFDSSRPAPVRIELTVGETVSGRVLDSEGKPAARAMVWAFRQDVAEDQGRPEEKFGLRHFSTQCEADGSFTVHGLPEAGTFRINAHLQKGTAWHGGHLASVAPGSKDLEIVLGRQ